MSEITEIEWKAKHAIPMHPIYADLLDNLKWETYINHLRMEWVKGYEAALKEFSPFPTSQDLFRVKEDMICPVTKEHCDDECCPVGAICNLSGNTELKNK